jgi:cytosine/adenosine deaminase-related metal-dependent hydrolase
VPGYAIRREDRHRNGATIDQGTVVIRNGVVESVTIAEESGGVEEIDGKGLVVYPPRISTAASADQPQMEPPKDPERAR